MLSVQHIQTPEVDLLELIGVISEITGVPSTQITSRCKLQEACTARQIAFKFLYDKKQPAQSIGKRFGRTHGAVLSGIRRLNLDMKQDFRVANKYERVKARIELTDPLEVLRIAHEGRG
jgi:chromosomal replication initiation ATPase DnaA